MKSLSNFKENIQPLAIIFTNFVLLATAIFVLFSNGLQIQGAISGVVSPSETWSKRLFEEYLNNRNENSSVTLFYIACGVIGALTGIILSLNSILSSTKMYVFVLVSVFVLTVYDFLTNDIGSVDYVISVLIYNLSGALAVGAFVAIVTSATYEYLTGLARSIFLLISSFFVWLFTSLIVLMFFESYPTPVRVEFSERLEMGSFKSNNAKPVDAIIEGIRKFGSRAGEVDISTTSVHPTMLLDIEVYRTNNCLADVFEKLDAKTAPVLKMENVKEIRIESNNEGVFSEIEGFSVSYPVIKPYIEFSNVDYGVDGAIISVFTPSKTIVEISSDDNMKIAFNAPSLKIEGSETIKVSPSVIRLFADGVLTEFSAPLPQSDSILDCNLEAKSGDASIAPGILAVIKAKKSDSSIRPKATFRTKIVSHTGYFLTASASETDDNQSGDILRSERVSFFTADFSKGDIFFDDLIFHERDGTVSIHGDLQLEWNGKSVKGFGMASAISLNGNFYRVTRWDLLDDTTKAAWWSALGFLLVGISGFIYKIRTGIANGYSKWSSNS